MKNLIIALFAFATTIATAQNKVEWVGGTPGQETNWNEPRNWSTNDVPDELSCVVISNQNSGHHSQPIIDDEVRVVSVEVQYGSELTITENGHLVLDGSETYSQGMLIYGGNLHNTGEISLHNIDEAFVINNATIVGIVNVYKSESKLIVSF